MFGLYIHIPFCRQKCNYCNFISSPEYNNNIISEYLACIDRELLLKQSQSGILDLKFDTIYIGGGTPSIFSEEQLVKLLMFISQYTGITREITVETNPESLTWEKLELLVQFGITRISIGLQSFNDTHLKTLGRAHDTGQFREMYRAARQYGMNNISVDLIYGIPGQSLQDWKGELAELVILNPEHISVYGLTIEEHTPFANNKIAVNDDLLADMYEHAIDYLANSGYEHYEISNFSKRTEGKSFQCLHNRIYWKNEQYIGLGTSAVSYLNNERTKNLNAISKYCDKLNAGQLPVQEKDVLTIPAKESETIILGLRLVNDGINLTDSQVNRFNDRINELVNDGLLIQSGTNIRLTKKGILLSNHVFRAFL